MIDWTQSMQQTFEYYEVDPNTWKDKKLLSNTILSCTINRDSSADTLGSASISAIDMFGECYIRVYLVAIQNGITERVPLGIFLIQTPSTTFDGKIKKVSIDAYTPLIELKENKMPLGYGLLKNSIILDEAYSIIKNNCRAPVMESMDGQGIIKNNKKLENHFIANTDDTYLSYVKDLLSMANFHLYLDQDGKILFAPDQKIEELQPKWTYDDGNSSILLPEIQITHDIYGMPNVIEIENGAGTEKIKIINDDPNSPISTVNRGREIIYRSKNPKNLRRDATFEELESYAKDLLKSASSIEYRLTYSHGYCPVSIDDCVRLNYERMGLNGITAKVIAQSMNCERGCTVSETAVYTKNIWVMKTNMPYSYDALEYVINKNKDNQINLNYNPNNETRIEIKFELTNSDIEEESYLFRTYNDKLWFKINDDLYPEMNYNDEHIDINTQLAINTLYIIDLDKNSLIIKNQNGIILYSHTFQSTTFNESSLSIFNKLETNSYPFIKLYYLNIYDDGKIARKCVSSRKKITGDLGLLDLHNNKFYKAAIQEHDETIIDPETQEPIVIHIDGMEAGPIIDFPE